VCKIGDFGKGRVKILISRRVGQISGATNPSLCGTQRNPCGNTENYDGTTV
jgi:hypothetical protein